MKEASYATPQNIQTKPSFEPNKGDSVLFGEAERGAFTEKQKWWGPLLKPRSKEAGKAHRAQGPR
jgi:hypothetical protein